MSMTEKRLFVSNLAYSVTAIDVSELFKEEGFAVESVHLVTEPGTEKSKGFCFVELVSADDVDKAIEKMNEINYEGRDLRVALAEKKDGRPNNRHPQRDNKRHSHRPKEMNDDTNTDTPAPIKCPHCGKTIVLRRKIV